MPPELTADIERVVPSPVQLCNEAVELIADDRNLAAKRLRAGPGVWSAGVLFAVLVPTPAVPSPIACPLSVSVGLERADS